MTTSIDLWNILGDGVLSKDELKNFYCKISGITNPTTLDRTTNEGYRALTAVSYNGIDCKPSIWWKILSKFMFISIKTFRYNYCRMVIISWISKTTCLPLQTSCSLKISMDLENTCMVLLTIAKSMKLTRCVTMMTLIKNGLNQRTCKWNTYD